MSWWPTGGGGRWGESPTESRGWTYERANADSPLRSSFAAVRVTMTEANAEVYVSEVPQRHDLVYKNKELNEPAVIGQLRSKQ